MRNEKWPKQIPELTDIQKSTRDDWMRYWHEEMPHKYGIIERFNHGFPAKTAAGIIRFTGGGGQISTLEIGAGLGEHIRWEDLSRQKYYTLELRNIMAEKIKADFPNVGVTIGDIQKRTPYTGEEFDRVIAIHVLEHLPNLPAALDEICRLMKPNGFFQVVIPCEGGLAYGFARQISSVRMFKKKFGDRGVDYLWMMKKTEHVNTTNEIIRELRKKFKVLRSEYFPLRLPFVFCNLCVGLNLQKL
jgi:SAM-dependent methyltransferase